MAKATVLKWFQRGWESFLDPERKSRVNEISSLLRREIGNRKSKFSLHALTNELGIDPDDLRLACKSAYRAYLQRALEDNLLTDAERRSLNWVADALQLSPEERREVDTEVTHMAFGRALLSATEDGYIDEAEGEQLRDLAAWMGRSVGDIVSDCFAKQGEKFLRSMFLSAVEDGILLHDNWRRFRQSAKRLGYTATEATQSVQRHAERLIEHVLADAKNNEYLSEDEEANLLWLLREFGVSARFKQYVLNEMRELKLITGIQDGQLPSITHPLPIELRAGEIVHFFGPSRFQRFRQLKSGTKVEIYDGKAAITDSRFIFSSNERPFTFNLGRVIRVTVEERYVDVQATAAATGIYYFRDKARIAGLILEAAVGRVNQTIVEKTSGSPSRHIPRDVRQRVWQRYGGQCAECASDQYLEFDHVIPVARGGSNGDNNIQLLCRRCNLKKSDSI